MLWSFIKFSILPFDSLYNITSFTATQAIGCLFTKEHISIGFLEFNNSTMNFINSELESFEILSHSNNVSVKCWYFKFMIAKIRTNLFLISFTF